MIAALFLCLGASLDFWSQDIPPLRASAARPLSGDPVLNCRRADLDADGSIDLIFSHGVALQRNGGFPADAFVPFPTLTTEADIDQWGPHLYIREANGLRVLRQQGNAWDTVAEYEVVWPPSEGLDPTVWQRGTNENHANLHPFLHDVEDDGVPEVIALSARGIHVYRLTGGEYVCAGPYGVLPAMRLAMGTPQPVWPPSARHLSFPVQEMACRANFDRAAVSLLTQESMDDGRTRFTLTRYPHLLADAPGEAPGAGQVTVTQPLPAHLRPCRLNGDAAIDYAGLRWDTSPPAPLPVPLLELWVTLDAGATIRRERMRLPQGYQPASVFTDVDHDGAVDLITENSGLFEGGPREAALRLQTQAAVGHELSVFRQTPQGFSKTPLFTHRLRIQLSAPPGREPAALRRYQAGGLVNLAGDFDGDGHNDIAVRDRPDRIALYRWQDDHFSAAPDAIIPLTYDVPFVVDDLNGDGRSDIITLSAVGSTSETVAQVHFSGQRP